MNPKMETINPSPQGSSKEVSMWVTCEWATCLVVVDENEMVVDTANVWRKFLNKPFHVLHAWLKSKGKVTVKVLKD